MYLLRFLAIFLAIFGYAMGMSRQQIKKTLGIMKNSCLTKTGATEDKVANIDQGQFLEEREVMCYIACIYKSIQVVKKDKLDHELISKQIDLLYPLEIRESVKNNIAKCIPTMNSYKDMCEGIFYAAKCLYEADPKNFIFA